MPRLTKTQLLDFQQAVWGYYEAHGRHELPWREPAADGTLDPYRVLVSELMLQQTQVSRVIPKFQEFLARFPSVAQLAEAPLAAVLQTWNGLGYNRRAKFLWQAAQQLNLEFHGQFPQDITALQALPGIGPGTAGAVLAYAFNQPAVFIETNIRTVFIYHFFPDRQTVTDRELSELVSQTLDRQRPRQWYWALMDYGSHLKKSVGNLNQSSSSYAKQSPFQGSRRQIRGQVIRILLGHSLTRHQLAEQITDPRLELVLQELRAEDLINYVENRYSLLADEKLMVE